MHPILARSGRLALYLGLWAFVGLLMAGVFAVQSSLGWADAALVALPLATTFSFVCLSAWYVARGMPLATTAAVRIATTAITASLVSSAGWVVIARGWMGFVSRRTGVADPDAVWADLQPLLFGFGVLLYLLAIAVSYMLAALEASQEAQRRGLQVQVLGREAELRSLRAQIDPHFLFNSLHSISALTAVDPQGARRMCLLLAEFLRDSLALGSESRITVEREFALIERFLAIERIRFGDRLTVHVSTGNAGRSEIAPLLLQPIVENAVTHGIAHVLDGGTIKVEAEQAGGTLTITVENPCDPDRPRRAGGGLGLANVRARLRALYGAAAWMTAGEEGQAWIVRLVMPAVTSERAEAGPPDALVTADRSA
jgi:two-component system sensor histidine kinase AlgZ